MNIISLLSLRAQADPAAAATVGKLVLSFSGDILNLIMRMERSQRRPSTMLQSAKLMSESVLDLETATGFWNMVSIRVKLYNFFAHTLPPWPDAVQPTPASPRTKEEQRLPSRPIASSTRVTIQSGEALTDAEPKAVPGSPAKGAAAGLTPHHMSPGMDRFNPMSEEYLYIQLGSLSTCCALVRLCKLLYISPDSPWYIAISTRVLTSVGPANVVERDAPTPSTTWSESGLEARIELHDAFAVQ